MTGKRNRLPNGTLRRRGRIYWALWKHDGHPFGVSLGTKDAQEAKSLFARQMSLVRTAIIEGAHGAKFSPNNHQPVEGDIALSAAWECFSASPRRPDCSPETLLHGVGDRLLALDARRGAPGGFGRGAFFGGRGGDGRGRIQEARGGGGGRGEKAEGLTNAYPAVRRGPSLSLPAAGPRTG